MDGGIMSRALPSQAISKLEELQEHAAAAAAFTDSRNNLGQVGCVTQPSLSEPHSVSRGKPGEELHLKRCARSGVSGERSIGGYPEETLWFLQPEISLLLGFIYFLVFFPHRHTVTKNERLKSRTF